MLSTKKFKRVGLILSVLTIIQGRKEGREEGERKERLQRYITKHVKHPKGNGTRTVPPTCGVCPFYVKRKNNLKNCFLK